MEKATRAAGKKFNSLPLTDVKMVQVKTATTTYSFITSDEVKVSEVVEEGKDRPLQIKNRLIANVPAEDVIMGYDLEFKDNVLCPELLQLMQGGTLTYDDGESGTGEFVSYEPPAIGTTAVKEKFEVITYSEITGTDGGTGKYAKMTWNSCKGKSVPIELKDGEYFANTYTVICRPAVGQRPYKLEIVDALPAEGVI